MRGVILPESLGLFRKNKQTAKKNIKKVDGEIKAKIKKRERGGWGKRNMLKKYMSVTYLISFRWDIKKMIT